MPKPVPAEHKADAPVEKNAFFSFSYGLFVLTARDGKKDNGCIINTAAQLTDTPKRVSIAVNKANFTHDMIRKTGVFNLSMLSTDAPFGLFQHYGFQSGRDVDKFADVKGMARATNGVYYLPYSTNAFVSGKVTQEIDLGTHTLFIADVTEAACSPTRRPYLQLLLCKRQAQAVGAQKADRLGLQDLRLCLRGRNAPRRFYLPAVQARRGGL